MKNGQKKHSSYLSLSAVTSFAIISAIALYILILLSLEKVKTVSQAVVVVMVLVIPSIACCYISLIEYKTKENIDS